MASFVNWARSKYPAERYILIPWNHGAGFSGLIQDMTQAGNDLMSLSEFRQALLSVEKVDIIDFDMCLMGGYETLAQLFRKG
ncbi:MAG: clostripain-related cysteine peptidase [Sandaracinaceae bacterium]|nr:clostripain-related cysteine peptidase [Sandaracinaceae bacterium]